MTDTSTQAVEAMANQITPVGDGYVACEDKNYCTWVPNDPIDIARQALAQRSE